MKYISEVAIISQKKGSPERDRANKTLLILKLVFAAGLIGLSCLFILKYDGNDSAALLITVILPLLLYVIVTAIIVSSVKKRFLWRMAEKTVVEATVIDRKVIDGPIQRDPFILMVGYSQKSVAPGGYLLSFKCEDDAIVNLLVTPQLYERHRPGSSGVLTYSEADKQLKFVSFE